MTFPFTAVVGQDDAKLALLLNAIDLRIGGVVLRGEKGSAKSTLARGLAALLPGNRPFVELPVGATEDRLIGSIDVAAALGDGRVAFHPGLLAAADGGVLYVDEVNLLPDHLVDALLDVAASGVNRVEREGVSHRHPSRFLLIGSMNPEEGELRPQLLDRFGLMVDVAASTDAAERATAVARRLAFDADPDAFSSEWAGSETDLAARLHATRPAALTAELLRHVSAVCAAVGAEGLRADLVLARAAAAHAGWDGRAETSVDDVRRVAPLALAHRRRRSPLDDPGGNVDELEQALDAVSDGAPTEPDERGAEPDEPTRVIPLGAERVLAGDPGRRSTAEAHRGRLVGERRPDGPVAAIAVGATARAAAARRLDNPSAPALVDADLRVPVREQKVGTLVILAVDASGSMGAAHRMEAAKGAVVSLLLDAYQRRDRVALVTFRDDGADVVLRPTASVEVARARLGDVNTGGRTPLAAGIRAALDVARTAGPGLRPLIVLVSDGRATAARNGDDPWAVALAAAADVRRADVDAVVVDVEDGPGRLHLGHELAAAMGARHVTVPELSAGALDRVVRGVTLAHPG